MANEYIVTAPDGKRYRVKGEGTKEQALEFFKQQWEQKQAQTQEQPQGQTQAAEEPSVLEQVGRQVGLTARGALTGVTSIPAMFADFLSVAGSKALGQPVPELPSQFIQRALTGVGLPEPKTPGERAVQAGVGAMTGIGLEAGLAQAAAKAAGTPAKAVVKDVAKDLMPRAEPLAQAAQRQAMLAPVAQAPARQIATGAAAAPAAQFTMESLAGAGYGEGVQLAGALSAALLAGGTTNTFYPKGRPIPTSINEIRQRSGRSYQELDNLGVTIKRDSALNFINNIERHLTKQGFNRAFDVYRDTDAALEALRRQITTGQRFGFRLSELDDIRKSILGRYKTASPQSQRMLKMMVDGFDDQLAKASSSDFYLGSANKDQAVKLLQDARKNWRLSARATVLENILDTTELRKLAGDKASEADLIRQKILGILSDPQKRANFSKQEQLALQQVGRTGKADALLSLVKKANIFRYPIQGAVPFAGAAYVDPLLATFLGLAGVGADITQSTLSKLRLEDLKSGILTGDVRVKPSMTPRAAVEAAKVGSTEQRPGIDVYYGDEEVREFLKSRGIEQ